MGSHHSVLFDFQITPQITRKRDWHHSVFLKNSQDCNHVLIHAKMPDRKETPSYVEGEIYVHAEKMAVAPDHLGHRSRARDGSKQRHKTANENAANTSSAAVAPAAANQAKSSPS